jgi:hypothetical protein
MRYCSTDRDMLIISGRLVYRQQMHISSRNGTDHGRHPRIITQNEDAGAVCHCRIKEGSRVWSWLEGFEAIKKTGQQQHCMSFPQTCFVSQAMQGSIDVPRRDDGLCVDMSAALSIGADARGAWTVDGCAIES